MLVGVQSWVSYLAVMLYLSIPSDLKLIEAVGKVRGARWRPHLKLWTVKDSSAVREAIRQQGLEDRLVEPDAKLESAQNRKTQTGSQKKGDCTIQLSRNPTGLLSPKPEKHAPTVKPELSIDAATALEEMLMREGAAYATRKSYSSAIRMLASWYAGDLRRATRDDLLRYLSYCIEEKRYSRATMNQVVNAIRAYYERVLGRPKDELRLPRPRKKRSLPNVCSEEEALNMLRETKNLKHRMILAMLYGLGLRKGELQKMLLRHVDMNRGVVKVVQSKGNKDRILVLQDSLKAMLAAYLAEYRPKHWLIEGQTGGQYSAASIQAVFVQAKDRSKLPEQLTVHGLRHSYATHLVERGTPLHVVKDLLGHENIQTTQIYLHTSSNRFVDVYDPLKGL